MTPHDEHALQQALELVSDEASFLAFLAAFAADWDAHAEAERVRPSPAYSQGALGWENGTIGSFLEAAHAGGLATLKNEPAQNPWRRAAEILYRGKICE